MAERRTFRVTDDDQIEGLKVIGFQGSVDPASTPAQRAPILVDGDNRLTRIAGYQSGPEGREALVESVDPPLPAAGDLPGVATRFDVSFPAIVDGVVVLAGRSEHADVHRIDLDQADLPDRVASFLRWLRDDQEPPTGACRAGGLWACYLTGGERRALWKALHAEVFRALRGAVRDEDPARMIAGAFRLSRVIVTPESDFFQVAEALRRAGSPHWKLMLREGLPKRDEKTWQQGLDEAALASPERLGAWE